MSRLTEDLERTIEEQRAEIARLKAENKRLQADYDRSHRRCNRMACSADIKDVQWMPATPGEGGGAR